MKLYHVTVVLLSGEERIYVRDSSWAAICCLREWRARHIWSATMRRVPPDERSPVCLPS